MKALEAAVHPDRQFKSFALKVTSSISRLCHYRPAFGKIIDRWSNTSSARSRQFCCRPNQGLTWAGSW